MKHAIIYVPGLGDHRTRGQQLAVTIWCLWGGNYSELIHMDWRRDEPFATKLERLLARIDVLTAKGYRVSLVGVSAGASAVINAYAKRPGVVHKVVCICGKLQHPETISPYTYQINPGFKESMAMLPSSLAQLNDTQRQMILSIRPLADMTVPPSDTIITDAKAKVIPTIGHVLSIALAITLYGPAVTRFIRKT